MSSLPLDGSGAPDLFQPRLARRRLIGRFVALMFSVLALLSVVVLVALLSAVLYEGWSRLSWSFLSNPPSRLNVSKAGVLVALWGTIWVISLTAVISVPTGVGAAIYLQEYSGPSRLKRWINLNIENLAGVPSIVYGILGLALFVRWMRLDRSVLAGALTMCLLVLPVIIIISQQALAAVPNSLRQAAIALGATRWQTIWSHVLPAAAPGIFTGVILAISRAIGEAAPLILIGGVVYSKHPPSGPLDGFSVLPIQIYNWADDPDPEFHQLSAAAIIVLLALLFMLNSVAVALRAWNQGRQAG